MVRAAAFIGVASFVLVGCSTAADAGSSDPADTSEASATAEVTPVGTWILATDESVELVVNQGGTYVISPCAAEGKWSDDGDSFGVKPGSVLDVAPCPHVVNLALVDRMTVEGDSLVFSDTEGNKESFKKLGD